MKVRKNSGKFHHIVVKPYLLTSDKLMSLASPGNISAPLSYGNSKTAKLHLVPSQPWGKCPSSTQKEIEEQQKDNADTFRSEIASITVTGIAKICNPKTNKLRKAVWIFILVGSIITTSLQIYDRIHFYVGEPTNVRVNVLLNNSLQFPRITICPYLGLGSGSRRTYYNKTAVAIRHAEVFGSNLTLETDIDVVKAVAELVPKDGVEKIWEELTFNVDVMIRNCFLGRGIRCRETGTFRKVYTVSGPCLMFQGPRVSLHGFFYGLYLVLDGRPSGYGSVTEGDVYRVLIHDPSVNPSSMTISDGWWITHGLQTDVQVVMRTFRYLRTNRNPCNSNPEASLSDCKTLCYERNVTAATDCRLPFMIQDLSKPLCDTPESFLATTARSLEVLEGVKTIGDGPVETWVASECNCDKPCQQTYLENVRSTSPRADDKAVIRVAYVDNHYEEIYEEPSYSVISLLCDIGGCLSLLLGASFLTILEVLEVCVYALLRKTKSKAKTSPK